MPENATARRGSPFATTFLSFPAPCATLRNHRRMWDDGLSDLRGVTVLHAHANDRRVAWLNQFR